MRFLSIAGLLLVLSSFMYCGSTTETALPNAQVRIQGSMDHCQLDSMRLFVPEGTSLKQIQSVALAKDTNNKFNFAFDLEKAKQGFYYIGGGRQNDTRLLVLGPDPQVEVYGQCQNLRNSSVKNSPRTDAYYQLKEKQQWLNQSFSTLLGRYRQNLKNPTMLEKVVGEMAELDEMKLKRLDSLTLHDPFMHKVFALQTYISYQNHGEGFSTEGEYFAKQFFQFVDLADPAFDRIPHVFEAFKSYATTLSRVGLMPDQQLTYCDEVLADLPPNTMTHRMAMLGLSQGFLKANTTAFLRFAERYVKDYGSQNPDMAKTLAGQIKSERAMSVGAIAPEIALPSPQGDTLRLSELRGKVVLIDFWASWCGPCRRENPNVVRMYKSYKDQGFEILGVSLDATQTAWEQAIAKDGLEWLHVSDLRRWRSVAAQTYGVSSIPATVLIDREGRIVARNLRGALLESKLAEVMGNG
ncbi:MAG: peroxiredoxin family protein [Bacteroidia bacterium]